jgi:hypothetical protein
MERNISIGLVIALVLTCIGAFWMSSHSSDGGGFLLDFLKNNTNTTTADNSTTNNTYTNSTINETINSTIENITDNSTAEISFDASAVYDANTSSVLISITSDRENITVDELNITYFYSLDLPDGAVGMPTPGHINEENVTLPTVVEVPTNENAIALSYYLDILCGNETYRVPAEGAYNVSLG